MSIIGKGDDWSIPDFKPPSEGEESSADIAPGAVKITDTPIIPVSIGDPASDNSAPIPVNTQGISHSDNSHSDNSHSDNSHSDNSGPIPVSGVASFQETPVTLVDAKPKKDFKVSTFKAPETSDDIKSTVRPDPESRIPPSKQALSAEERQAIEAHKASKSQPQPQPQPVTTPTSPEPVTESEYSIESERVPPSTAHSSVDIPLDKSAMVPSSNNPQPQQPPRREIHRVDFNKDDLARRASSQADMFKLGMEASDRSNDRQPAYPYPMPMPPQGYYPPTQMPNQGTPPYYPPMQMPNQGYYPPTQMPNQGMPNQGVPPYYPQGIPNQGMPPYYPQGMPNQYPMQMPIVGNPNLGSSKAKTKRLAEDIKILWFSIVVSAVIIVWLSIYIFVILGQLLFEKTIELPPELTSDLANLVTFIMGSLVSVVTRIGDRDRDEDDEDDVGQTPSTRTRPRNTRRSRPTSSTSQYDDDFDPSPRKL